MLEELFHGDVCFKHIPSSERVINDDLSLKKAPDDCSGKIGKIAQTGSIAPRRVRLMTQIFDKFDFSWLARRFLLCLICLNNASPILKSKNS